MQPLFEDVQDDLEIYNKKSIHVSPHLHTVMEIVYVTEGSLELGIGQDLFHMEKGDFAIVFPDMIHHYQVFDTRRCRGIYILASPNLCESFADVLAHKCPKNPVISAADVHEDISFAISKLTSFMKNSQIKQIDHFDLKKGPYSDIVIRSYLQIVLARALPMYELIDKDNFESNDIIYRAVSYISSHFTERVTLTSMARDLYISPYALSRMFSSTFHTNFNGYLNNKRLEYVVNILQYTDQSITMAYENAGFESQRTFNRVFTEKYHMSPREYRKMLRNAENIDT